ncbi:MAG: site-2 protease family protein [Verrucomicrobiota bacterium]
MPAQLYRVDNCRLTLRECWYQTRSANVIVLWFLKLFRIRMPIPPMPYPESVHQNSLPPESIPEAARKRLDPLVSELEGEGFHSTRFYRYATSRAQTEIYLAALLHPRGESIARVMYVVSHQTQPPTEKTRVFLLSELADGTWFVTSPLRPEFNPNPGVEVQRVIDAPPARLARAHAEALLNRASAHPVVTVTGVENAEFVSDRYERHCFDANIHRRLYVPLNESEESEEQAAVVATEKAGTEVGSENAAIQVELERLQNPKSSLKNVLWILGGSLLAFVILGGAQWDLEFLAIILPILLVHEAGHWVAMRIFGYRNLRMFFIPLFGAAVSGQNFNVAGWKKALVSLAGPVPGILIGTAMAIVALRVDQPWMEKAAMLAVVVNSINLLPFVPLDGGWFLNATVFCRRAWLETGFKVLAIAALIVAGATTGDRLWTGLAILMAMSISRTWRLGKLAEQLRTSGISSQSVDQQTIPPETAAQLITAVKGSTTKARTVKLLAGEVLDLFERLNARPPGVLTTLSLIAVYIVTLGIAFLGLGVAGLARNGALGLLDLQDSDLPEATQALDCGQIRSHTGTGAWPAGTNQVHLVGLHPDSASAAAAWASLTNFQPAQATQVGPLVVAMFPRDAKDAIATAQSSLSPLGTNFLKLDLDDGASLRISLKFQPPAGPAGTKLFHQLETYFSLPGFAFLISPWTPGLSLTPDQQQARETWRILSSLEHKVEQDPAVKAQRRKMLRAFQRGNTNAMNEAVRESEALRKRLLSEREAALSASTEGLLDPEIVLLKHDLREPARSTNIPPTRYLRLGVFPEEINPSSNSLRELSAYGNVRMKDGAASISFLSFEEPARGLPALVNWLCTSGATDLRMSAHLFPAEPDEAPAAR